MDFINIQPKFYLSSITNHIQDASTNNEIITYGSAIGPGGQAHGTALIAGSLGDTSISAPSPVNSSMAVLMQIGNGPRICLGILDNLSTQHAVSIGSKAIYSQDNLASIDLISGGVVQLNSTKTKLNTSLHTNVDVDDLVKTVNALVNSFNSLLTALGTTLAGTYNLTPVPAPPLIAQTPALGPYASLNVSTTLPQP